MHRQNPPLPLWQAPVGLLSIPCCPGAKGWWRTDNRATVCLLEAPVALYSQHLSKTIYNDAASDDHDDDYAAHGDHDDAALTDDNLCRDIREGDLTSHKKMMWLASIMVHVPPYLVHDFCDSHVETI